MKKKTLFLIILPLLLLLLCLFAAPLLSGNGTSEVLSPMEAASTASPKLSLPVPTILPTATPVPTEPPFQEYDISLMALGDNLIHMGIVHTGKQADGTYDYSFLFRGMEPFLEAADLKVINQETILGGNELGFSGFPAFNSPTEVGDAIADAGFQVVLHATNHAADMGLEGIQNCLSFWQNTYPDILVTGIHSESEETESETASNQQDAIPLITIKDVTFAVLNYTYGPNVETIPKSIRGHLNILCDYNENNGQIDFTTLNPKVCEDIAAAKELADMVIVFPHWGTEYQKTSSSYQKKFALQMTEAGADLIIGTHPHVPQPVEWITAENGNQSLCYYSLGNYVSTQKKALSMLEEMAWVTFHVTEEEVSISTENTGVVPLVCHYNSPPVRLEQVYPLEDYTEEMAARHGIKNYGGVTLSLEELKQESADIFGEWILLKSDILPSATDND